MRFTHLHVHSHYSLLDGLGKINELVAKASELGMDSLALTDHGALYGAIEFYQKAKKSGIKPIIGCEMYIAAGNMREKRPGIDDKRYHLTVLAQNNEGYKNLINLVSSAHLDGFYYKPRVDKEELKKYSAGLIALSGCFNGEIPRAIQSKKMDLAERLIGQYQEIFGKDNFYLELGAHFNYADQKITNDGLVELSRITGAKLVATNDIHYINPEDSEAQDILVSVQTGAKIQDEDRLTMRGANLSMRSADEMSELFHDLPEAIINTQEIASKCDVEIHLGENQLPHYTVPDGFDANSYLKKLCEEGIEKRYGRLSENITNRLNYELTVIGQTGFASYFLIVQDFVNWAKNSGIVVGPGRGSAAGSLVSYLLQITNIDPIKYNLLFERFLNPERISMPDIDLDFADTRRDEVIDYVAKKYGRDHVAQIITFGTMAARAAIRDTGRALGYPYSFCDQIAKMIPFNPTQGEKTGWLKKCLENVPELKAAYSTNPDAKKLLDSALKLEGVARHASTHACGVVVSPKPLREFLPLQYAVKRQKSKNNSEREQALVTQYEMHAVEDLGLLKMDFLGLRNLTIIENTLVLIKKLHGIEINVENIPLDDSLTFRLFQEGKTTGLFQFECLSRDTFISNTTIKQLYERQNKKILESVYLDEGKVHKNKIVKIIKSGTKETHTLITDNGWYVRATKDHFFLTENGWKKLSEISVGGKILIKMNAKHMTYRMCQACKKQINGRPQNKSQFCYSCSSSFYKNPSKPISRKRMKAARIKFFQEGGRPWNVGITVENSEIWRETAQKISKALMGRSLEERCGEKIAEKMKKKLSERSRGERNPMFGKPPPHRKGGFREDLGFYVRSNWEADFARILNLYGAEFQYEPKQFALVQSNGNVIHYTPDFYTPNDNTFYEIKGWMRDADKEKIELFREQYPQYNFILINTTKFAELALKHKNLVRWECPAIPVKRQFKFVEVKEIKYYGLEETYDIAMESPGNNFVANGFLAHNSSGMKRYLKELKPTELEDLIAMVSLYRPGPMELIPSYIKRKHGQEKVYYLHQRLEPILKNTHGIGVYQEQMMQIARDLAGFTLPEADTLRKAIGKKIKTLLAEQKEKLISGMLRNGISQETAEQIWELFPPFARYGFNRSHAACYALIAYQTGYLKARYPTEFMASIMTAEGFETERVAELIEEAREMGIEVMPPDVNESFENFTVVTDKKIRFGLNPVKNVGENIVEAIIATRKSGGKFVSLTDFLERVTHKDLNKKSLESLIRCGALDNFGERKQLLVSIETLLEYSRSYEKNKSSGQVSLFGATPEFYSSSINLVKTEPALKKEKLQWEKELLGLYVTEHPLQEYAEKLKLRGVLPLKNLNINLRGQKILAGGIISGVKKIITKSGESMLFVKLEDLTGRAEVLVFPRVLSGNPNLWQADKILMIRGRLSDKDGEPKILCEEAVEVL